MGAPMLGFIHFPSRVVGSAAATRPAASTVARGNMSRSRFRMWVLFRRSPRQDVTKKRLAAPASDVDTYTVGVQAIGGRNRRGPAADGSIEGGKALP